VRDDLDERHEGDRQPGNVPVKAALLAAAVLLLAGCGSEHAAQAERTVLLVSGRDDHGLLVQKQIGLSQWIGGEPDAHVPDGTLVRVEATHGEWIQVRALEGSRASGWVNDYYLRGTAFARDAQVELLEFDGASVQVRSLQTKRVAWMPRNAVSQLPMSRAGRG
jgi:hypothetical protein